MCIVFFLNIHNCSLRQQVHKLFKFILLSDTIKPCRVVSTTTIKQGDFSVPSSEDENEDKGTDTKYCPESADELESSEMSSNDGSDQLVKLLLNSFFHLAY